MKNEGPSSSANKPNVLVSITTMKKSLHARKWATLDQRSSCSTSSTSHILNLDNPTTDKSTDSLIEAVDEEIEESVQESLGDYELSSRSKRKISDGLLYGATKAVSEMLAGVSGVDIPSDGEDFSNTVTVDSKKPKTDIAHGFERRNTRRLHGPSGEKILLHSHNSLSHNNTTNCILEVEHGDSELLGFVERVLDATQVDGYTVKSNGESTARPSLATTVDVHSQIYHDTRHHDFRKPLLSSTFNQEGDMGDSSEYSPNRHMSFDSADLPLSRKVAPIPRILDIQQGEPGRGGDDGTTTDSEEMYSSHNSSQVDLNATILHPIHTQSVRSTLQKEEPDFEELERYFPNHQMSLFVGTWNMHSEKDVPLLVEEFLLPPQCEYLQDMYIIGTQECTPHNTSRREWEVTVQATLGPTHVLVRSESLGDIHLIILVRREMIWIIRDVQSNTVACGAGGVMRNKGAVGIILTIFGTSVLCITAHLRAHASKVKERNFDAVRISTAMDFSRYATQPDNLSTDCTDKADCVFWFGDLNYRVECEREVADRAIRSHNLEPLIRNDQLRQQIRDRAAFQGFTEAPIKFPPTFKFDPGTTDYDTSNKQRVPSWTDRILYKSRQDSITPQLYHYCPKLTFSDHRPVFGVYLVNLKPSPISSTLKATGWFDKRAYARGMKRRQMYPTVRSPSIEQTLDKRKFKQQSFMMRAVNAPVKKVMANHKSSTVCSIM